MLRAGVSSVLRVLKWMAQPLRRLPIIEARSSSQPSFTIGEVDLSGTAMEVYVRDVELAPPTESPRVVTKSLRGVAGQARKPGAVQSRGKVQQRPDAERPDKITCPHRHETHNNPGARLELCHLPPRRSLPSATSWRHARSDSQAPPGRGWHAGFAASLDG